MRMHGKEISEEQIDEWVAEAEAGYDVEVIRKGGRKPMGEGPARVVPVRLDDALLAAIDNKAQHDHVSRSEIIRAALRSFVA